MTDSALPLPMARIYRVACIACIYARVPWRIVRLRSVSSALWVLDYELAEARDRECS